MKYICEVRLWVSKERTITVEFLDFLLGTSAGPMHQHLGIEAVVGHQTVCEPHPVRPHRIPTAIVEVCCAHHGTICQCLDTPPIIDCL